MTINKFVMPGVNFQGLGCLEEAIAEAKAQGAQKLLIVTDKGIEAAGVLAQVEDAINKLELAYVVHTDVQPNPTKANVMNGLAVLKDANCDFVMSLGGGSPHDCAKAIALLATNEGATIDDFVGFDVPGKNALPLIAINTTAGTAAEMTRFAVITCEDRHIKMPIVNQKLTPAISVNDPALMLGLPAHITAATGMDALTHAIEAYISIAASPLSDANAEKAISLIGEFLPRCVEHGKDAQAREMMAYAEFMAGMAFNNASVGYVHALAHQLGAVYNLPHGLCNALLLPHVLKFVQPSCKSRMAKVADLLGANDAATATAELAKRIGLPATLTELYVKEEDIEKMAKMAVEDVSALTSPRQASVEEVMAIYRAAM
ncbi:alcohol dehydrogenase [Vibrio maritimus]|uniref:Alcohol dehydrogenase n=1 Tax=Vibrio maritimus TaxID=990268 RepID=A0A090TUK6_9VIBR|nr:alcohol dehydrogenase [Vibrio maritimus]